MSECQRHRKIAEGIKKQKVISGWITGYLSFFFKIPFSIFQIPYTKHVLYNQEKNWYINCQFLVYTNSVLRESTFVIILIYKTSFSSNWWQHCQTTKIPTLQKWGTLGLHLNAHICVGALSLSQMCNFSCRQQWALCHLLKANIWIYWVSSILALLTNPWQITT